MENKYLSKKKEMTRQEFFLQEEAYLRGNDLNHTFYVAKDTRKNGKVVTSFKSIDEFLIWAEKQKEKHFYEKIINERVEYYDIDGKIEDNDYWTNDKTTIINDFLQARKEWIDTTEYNNKDINIEKDVFILESRNLNFKKSFHIIIRNNFVFKNNLDQKKFIKSFNDFLNQKNSGFVIDTSPYGQNQCLRTIDSSKKGSDRVLIRSDYNKLSLECDKRLFFPSWILPELQKASETSCISNENQLGRKENLGYLNYVKNNQDKDDLIPEINLPEIPINNGQTKDLVDLILETIDDNQSPICDTEHKNKLNYLNWYKLVLTVFNCITDHSDAESICRSFYEKLFSYYRHSSGIDKDRYFEEFLKNKDRYTKLSNNTLHYLARFNKKYENVFKNDKNVELFRKRLMFVLTQKNIEFLMKPTFITPVNDDSEYVDEKKFNTDHKVICVKAGLGRGKSYASIQHIKQHKYDNIIILTPRRSYARSCCDRMVEGTGLDFQCYLNIKKKIINNPLIVIQAESLYKLDIRGGKNLLIIDEVEAFLYQLTSVDTHAENHIKNVETFMSLVKHSSKILALDAFLSNRTLQTFTMLLSKDDISFINYTQKLNQRTVSRIDNVDCFISKLINDLEQGKKIFLFSSSNTKLLKKKKKVYKDHDKDDVIINALLPAIREKLPGKNILEFHSNYVSMQLKNVNEDWDDADLVACTSTITVGINHDKKNVFHKLYLYANASSQNLVRDMFQASYRVRHLIDDEMVCCIDERHYGKNKSTNITEIKQDLHQKHTSLINHFKQYTNKQFPYETPQFIEYLSIFNKLESNLSIMNLEDFFNAYLAECNYKYSEDQEDILEIEFDEFIVPQIDYDDIVEILPSKAKQLINKKKTTPLTEEENSSLEKYHFQNILLYRPKEVEKPLWDIYTNFGKGKFRNISTEKGLSEGTITIKDLIDKNSYSHLNNGFSMRCQVIGEIFNWIGLNNSQQYTTKIKRDTLQNVIQKFEENRKKITIAFDIKERTKGELTLKSTMGLINAVLNKWGYSNIKSGKREMKRINGKRVDVSDFVVENKNGDIDVHHYIKPRTIIREEKLHPLLYKGDENIITCEELENIRLNPSL